MIDTVKNYLIILQQQLCQTFSDEDGQGKFQEDEWMRDDGSHGKTCVLANGAVIEKAGINFSHVKGDSLPISAVVHRTELANALSYQAMGVSLIIHPRNPYVPTTHLNVRFIVTQTSNSDAVWWFGGGFDLTPYYAFEEDCIHWHSTARIACAPFGADVYPRYKKWCDDYFYLKHRQEPRGIGGLFFDELNAWGFDQCFAFMKSIGEHFILAYHPIMQRRKSLPFNQQQRDFQCYRRGRYVEFNLLYDRGTLFGLQSGGRTESILISLPPQVSWHYNWQPKPDSEEAALYEKFLVVRDWV